LYVDQLTGIANRNRLIDVMDKTRHQIADVDVKGGLILLDINRFKLINQIHGEDIGDALLTMIAERLVHEFSQRGLVARVGSNEFAVFFPNSTLFKHTEDWLLKMAQNVLECVAMPFNVKGEKLSLMWSLGLATLHRTQAGESKDVFDCLNNANVAMRALKDTKGQGFVVFNDDMLEASLIRHHTEQALALAIAQDELRLFVQPQVAQNRQVVGLECLVRWQHPQKGLVFPSEFIPIAEQSDLIVTLGAWVLRTACSMLKTLQQHDKHIKLSVNVSVRHFRQAHFVEQLTDFLAEHEVNANGLVIEITEGLFLDGLDDVVSKMRQLKELGIEFSIDDFGTGYSSLSYLESLPVDEIKIDRSFILSMEQHGQTKGLVSTIFAMGEELNMRVVAEGIENAQQENLLSPLHGIVLQGYMFGRPQPFEAWLSEWQKSLKESV
jgi:diguanylate cyclase (GGDEF)-like protein